MDFNDAFDAGNDIYANSVEQSTGHDETDSISPVINQKPKENVENFEKTQLSNVPTFEQNESIHDTLIEDEKAYLDTYKSTKVSRPDDHETDTTHLIITDKLPTTDPIHEKIDENSMNNDNLKAGDLDEHLNKNFSKDEISNKTETLDETIEIFNQDEGIADNFQTDQKPITKDASENSQKSQVIDKEIEQTTDDSNEICIKNETSDKTHNKSEDIVDNFHKIDGEDITDGPQKYQEKISKDEKIDETTSDAIFENQSIVQDVPKTFNDNHKTESDFVSSTAKKSYFEDEEDTLEIMKWFQEIKLRLDRYLITIQHEKKFCNEMSQFHEEIENKKEHLTKEQSEQLKRLTDHIQNELELHMKLEQDQSNAENLAVALHHTDAILTQYELNPMAQNLMDITDALEQNCDDLEDLKNKLEGYKNHQSQRLLQVKTRLIYLTNLYANLLTRLQALRSVCDHSIQVKFLE